ncbi:MAG: hypothetical protein IPN34_18545 [Planctomycetes bacterium]|nr:hypothetical protein [Planctomycetota bacterium]
MRLDDAPSGPPVMLRARRLKLRAVPLALAALLLVGAGAGTWLALRPTPIEARATQLSSKDLLAALRAQKWPDGLKLPAYYSEPEFFLLKKHREAQSPLMVYWNAQTRDQKLYWLHEAIRLQTPFALPLLAELAYFSLPNESDGDIASTLLSALAASSHQYLDLAIFIADFVAQTAVVEEVIEYASDCSRMLADRRRQWGH